MRLKTVIVKGRLEWEKPDVDYFIPADTYRHEEVLDMIAR